MEKVKYPTSYRFSVEADRLLGLLSEKLGLPKTGVLEIAIRLLAKREKVE